MVEHHLRHDEARSIENLNSFSAILLALFTIVSFTANTFLVVTISTSARLRSYVINYFLLHLAVVNLLDTMFNMVFTLIYISMGVSDWTLGDFFCDLNAFFGQLVTILTLGGLTLLSVDRGIALLQMAKYRETFTPIRAGSTIGALYAIALCFTVPILVGSINAGIYVFRYFCSIAENNDVVYVSMLLVICYIFPLIVVLFAFGIIFFKARLERMHRPSSDMRFTSDHIVETRRFQQNLLLSKFVVAIIILFILIQGPYIVLNFVGLLRNSRQILVQYYDAKLQFESDAETGITWLKFVFPVVYPFLVFGFCKDIWKKFQDLICCRRSNMIRSAKTAVSAESSIDNVDTLRAETMEGTRVPTLVATAGGLHLRTTQYDGDGRMAADEYAYADLQRRAEHRNRTRHFDNLDSHGATSDYDSEDSQSWADAADPVKFHGGEAFEEGLEMHKLNKDKAPISNTIGNSNASTADDLIREGNMSKRRMQVTLPEPLSFDEETDHLDGFNEPGPSTKFHSRTHSDSAILKHHIPKPILKQAYERKVSPGYVKLVEHQQLQETPITEPQPLQYSDFSSPEKENMGITKGQHRVSASVRLPPIQRLATLQKVHDIHKLDLGSLSDAASNSGIVLNHHTEPSLGRYSNRISPDAAAKYVSDISTLSKLRRKSNTNSDILPQTKPASVEYRKTVSADVMNNASGPTAFKKRKFRPQPLGDAPQPAWQY